MQTSYLDDIYGTEKTDIEKHKKKTKFFQKLDKRIPQTENQKIQMPSMQTLPYGSTAPQGEVMMERNNLEIRMMNLEQCISQNNIKLSERITRMEVKINILTYVAGVVLVSTLGVVVSYLIHI